MSLLLQSLPINLFRVIQITVYKIRHRLLLWLSYANTRLHKFDSL